MRQKVIRLEITQKPNEDTIHINKAQNHVKGHFYALELIDKDTKQHVLYIPALELSGYGETPQKAKEILKFSAEQYFEHLLTLSADALQKELRGKGWKKNPLRNKDYSKAYVDDEGELKNFNALEGKVQRVALTI